MAHIKLAKFTKIVSPLFLVFGIFAVVCTILSILQIDGYDGWITFALVFLSTIIFGIIAALGVYKWGTVSEQIELFKEQNGEYEREINSLKNNKKDLQKQVTHFGNTTSKLKRDVDQLQATLSQYDELKESLKELVTDNEELNDVLNNVNDMYYSMRKTILSNTKAGLLSAYYDVLKTDQNGMSESQYRRFKGRLDTKTRRMFPPFDKLDTDHNGLIDLNELQRFVDGALSQQQDEDLFFQL
eukprot:206243_1